MDGILIVDKPQGMTSHDVVNLIRRRFNLKKVGHAGTLDPMATGVLVMLLGKCTKSSSRLIGNDKEYEGTMVLGATSDTGDAWGNITASSGKRDFTDEEIRGTFNKFTGELEQVPPMYSAVKFKGKKLYELARKGLSVEVKPRKVFIKGLEVTDMALPQISFKAICSKGTYIRQLCADIGKALGCGAYLSRLRRTRSGEFSIDEALSADELKRSEKTDLEKKLKRI